MMDDELIEEERQPLTDEEAELQNAQMRAWLLPDQPTEQSLHEARIILITFLKNKLPLPEKLRMHFDMLPESIKISGNLSTKLRRRSKELRAIDARLLSVLLGMLLEDACREIYKKAGVHRRAKCFYDDVCRKSEKKYKPALWMSDEEVYQLYLEETKIYGVSDPEELAAIIKENVVKDKQ